MLGNQISLTNNVAKQVVSVTATQNQTDFTVQGGYRINQLGVYRNGVRLVDGRDFLARNGSSVTLVSQGANAGDAMEFVVFDDFRVADALSVNTGGTVNAAVNIKGSADQPTLTYDGSGVLKVGDTAVELAIGRENANPFGSYLQARASNGAARDILLNPVGGDVGIGTDNPNRKLVIAGDAGTGAIQLKRTNAAANNGNSYGTIWFRNADDVDIALIRSRRESAIDDSNICFETTESGESRSEKLRITGIGSVGIGNTIPETLLHVTGDKPKFRIESTNALDASLGTEEIGRIEWEARKSSNDNVAASIRVRQDGTWSSVTPWHSPTSIEFFTQDNSGTEITDPRLTIKSTGDVGIGTDSPPARLSGVIQSNITKYLPPDYNENWAGAFINEEDGATYNGVLIANRWRGTESTVLKVGSLFNAEPDFDPYFTIDGVGKVGIGTDVPESNFHIVNSSGNNSTGPAKPGIHMGEGGTNDYHIHINSVTSDGNAYIDFSEPGVDYHSRIIKTMGGGFVFIQQENQVMQFRTNGTTRMQISGSGNVQVVGSLSKGSGSFKIDHPLVGMSTTHNLVHSFIEGPQADLIYRGKVDLVGGSATVNIDTAGRMTEGTFNALCTNVQCFTSNETDWTAVKGSVSGNVLTITAQENTSTATVSWMVVGERKDQHMIDTEWTDDNGRVITEPIKEIISDV